MGEAFLLNNYDELVEWKKWNCYWIVEPDVWQEAYVGVTDNIVTEGLSGDSGMWVYNSYEFSQDNGFNMGGMSYVRLNDLDSFNCYTLHQPYNSTNGSNDQIVYTVATLADNEGSGEIIGTLESAVAMAVLVQYGSSYYERGGTSYGSVFALEGELPEVGTLQEGSANSSYCVVRVNGTDYYYVKV